MGWRGKERVTLERERGGERRMKLMGEKEREMREGCEGDGKGGKLDEERDIRRGEGEQYERRMSGKRRNN